MMSDFYVTEIEVKDGYPELKQLPLEDNTKALQHFLDRLYRETPREEWSELHDIINIWSLGAQTKEMMFPNGEWVINLGGDKVRAPSVEREPEG